MNKRVVQGTNPGPVPVLSNEEEGALVEYVSTWVEEVFNDQENC